MAKTSSILLIFIILWETFLELLTLYCTVFCLFLFTKINVHSVPQEQPSHQCIYITTVIGGPTAHSPLTFSTPASRGLCSQTKSLQQLLTHRQSAPAACYSLSANNYCFAFAVAAAGKSVLQLQFLIGRLIILYIILFLYILLLALLFLILPKWVP